MKRRDLLVGAAGAMLLPYASFTSASATPVEYTPESFKAALESGKPLLLDFYATW